VTYPRALPQSCRGQVGDLTKLLVSAGRNLLLFKARNPQIQ